MKKLGKRSGRTRERRSLGRVCGVVRKKLDNDIIVLSITGPRRTKVLLLTDFARNSQMSSMILRQRYLLSRAYEKCDSAMS